MTTTKPARKRTQPRGRKVSAVLRYVDKNGYSSLRRIAFAFTQAGHPMDQAFIRYCLRTWRPKQYEGWVRRNRKLNAVDPDSVP